MKPIKCCYRYVCNLLIFTCGFPLGLPGDGLGGTVCAGCGGGLERCAGRGGGGAITLAWEVGALGQGGYGAPGPPISCRTL